MKYKTLKSVSVISALFAAFSLSAFAQTPTSTKSPTPVPTATPATMPTQTPKPADPLDDGEIIKVESRLVVVPVSITDAAGQPVLGLKAQDFLIKEEGNAQEIDQVRDAEKVPLDIAILFDVSSSVDPMFELEQQTAAKFLQEVMRPEDRAAVFTVGDRPVMLQGRDTAEKAAATVRAIQPATKQVFTSFYDAVNAAAAYLEKNSPVGRRRVLLIISDGEDTNSEGVRRGFAELDRTMGAKFDTMTSEQRRNLFASKREQIRSSEQAKVLKVLQNADAVFYAINPAGGSFQLNKISQFGQSNLQTFADQTGGTAFVPKFLPVDLKDKLQNSSNARWNQELLTRIFKQLANELQAQYLIQYYSEGNFSPGRYVKLGVGLKSPSRLKVRSRQGYFVKN